MINSCCPDGVNSVGPTTAQIMIVGHQPGTQELKTKMPFTGENGRYLDSLLESVSIPRSSVYLTNISCKAVPPTPLCSRRFEQEIKTIKPKLIITLGAEAALYFNKSRKLGTIRGVPIYTETPYPHYVMSTWQPISVVHGKYDFIIDVLRDFRKIDSILNHSPLTGGQIQYEHVTNPQRAQEILNSLPRNAPVALDIETLSPSTEQTDAFESRVICFAINDGNSNFVFDASVLDSVTFPSGIQWLYHNGPFDTSALKLYHNLDLPIVHDTMMMSYALDERGRDTAKTTRHGYHGLKVLAREYCFADFWEEQKNVDLHKYNALDVHNTYKLYNHFDSLLDAENVRSLYENLLIPTSNAARDWQTRGVYIDKEVVLDLRLQWLPILVKSERKLQRYAAEHGFPGDINVNSPKQLSKFLYEVLSLPGGPSTDKEALYGMNHEFVTDLQKHRQLTKIISTNLQAIPPLIKFDNRLHPQPYIHGTVTGRFSYHDPNVQNIPQEHTVGDLAILRRMFAQSNPDYIIMEADYNQIEVWLAAGFSGDSQMLQDLRNPFMGGKPDFHSNVCQAVFNIAPDSSTLWSDRRFQSKKITFGNVYDEGANTLANPITGIGCTVAEAARYINTWKSRYPTFVEWRHQVHKEILDNGYLTSPFGRRRRLPVIFDHRQLRQAANFPIQSAASDYTLTSALTLHKLLPQYDSHILFLVHDSIVLEVNRKYESEVRSLVTEVMTQKKVDYLPSVNIEIKSGENWYDVK